MLDPRPFRLAPRRALASSMLVAAAVALSPSLAGAHFVLQAPTSWSTQDSLGGPQKLAPCGSDGSEATGEVNAVQEGQTITITINETIFHPGHYRVSLSVHDRSELPPEPVVTPGDTPCGSVDIQDPPVFPVLADGMLAHTSPFSGPQSFQVTLPEGVTCDHCTLQIIEFMSEHGLNNPGGCFYHHCADLSIQSVPVMGTGGSAGSGDAGSGQAGSEQAGSGDAGSGQAGAAGSGNAGDAGSGQAGMAGSGPAGSGGAGGSAQAGSGNAGGKAGSGTAGSGNAGSGTAGQAGSKAGSGQGGSGQAGTAGKGQTGNGTAGSSAAGGGHAGSAGTAHAGSGASGSAGDSAGGAAGSQASAADSGDDSGCSLRATNSPGAAGLVSLAALAMILRRRRR